MFSKKMKADDSIEYSLIEPTQIYLRSINDDTGDALQYFSIQSCPFQSINVLSPIDQNLL